MASRSHVVWLCQLGFELTRDWRTLPLSLVDISKDLAAFLPGYALEEHTIGAASVEVPFYHHVSLSLTGDALCLCILIGKDIVLEIAPDLVNPLVWGSLKAPSS